jgi:phosphate transport system substrate-binding protein
VSFTYGAIGSGGGIAQLTDRTIDFGASDAPLTPEQARSCKGCVQIPWALAATLVSYRLDGLSGKLRLSGPLLARIYLGEVTRWDDPAIGRLNPGRALPATRIAPVYRSDGSGDTFAFTSFLSAVSPRWRSKVGADVATTFPGGVGGRGNQGAAAAIERTNGSIGYLSGSYVFANGLRYALVENAAGRFPEPNAAGVTAAATASPVGSTGAVSIVDPPASAPSAYPISTFSYALVPRDSDKAAALRDFLRYAVTSGQRLGVGLRFAPLPPRVVEADRRRLALIG